jgi:ectoine hydroxylase-related dioxygenase (phytanoyl-CoA dioxygenase family)
MIYFLQCHRNSYSVTVTPGSHLKGRQPKLGEDADKAVAIDAPAGSIVLWLGDTWHGAFPKVTPGLRVTLTAMFCRPYVTPQEDFRAFAEKIDLSRYPARLKMLLGLANVMGSTSPFGPDFTGMEQLYAEVEQEDGMQVEPVYHSRKLY